MKLVTKKIALGLALIGSTLAVNSAMAATANSTMNVNTTVSATCLVITPALAFGSFTPNATTDIKATTTSAVTCSKGLPYTLSFTSGSGASMLNRSMSGTKAGNTDLLKYQLYGDSAYQNVLGDGSTGTTVLSGTATGSTQNYTIYGKVPAGQFLTPDSYSDMMAIVITY